MNIDIPFILSWYKFLRQLHTAKRPWAHHTKKGPGRKHQQGRVMTKEERNNKGSK